VAVNVLGISAFYHDSAAALVRDGEIIAAAQEERFSRRKHDPRFPAQAISYCLEEAFIDPSELAAVVCYENPAWTLDRIVSTVVATAPESREHAVKALPVQLGIKMRFAEHVARELGAGVKVLYSPHHHSHAASAFYPSPFGRAAILVVDGVGEWATTSIGIGDGGGVRLIQEIRYPHSLGLLYTAVTVFCGFKANSGEYKLMGLAPYGTPRYADRITQELIDLRPDGSYRLNLDYFGYVTGTRMTNDKFAALFDGEARAPESRITRREMDLAASIQVVLNEAMGALARHAVESTGCRDLVLAGGVALNCVANGELRRSGMIDGMWIQPAAGDAGGALGGALAVAHEYFGVERKPRRPSRDAMKAALLGPRYTNDEVEAFLDRRQLPYTRVDDAAARARIVADALQRGLVVGVMCGRMEFGPRALGARSILGNPMDPATQTRMNLKIKFRESFRPFAPSVVREDVSEYFELDEASPYMLIVAPVQAGRRQPMAWDGFTAGDDDLTKLVAQARSDIPAVTHVDYSARVQTVDREDSQDYYDIIAAFKALTGCGVVVNTSFNVRGEPIVCTPDDAYRCFMRTEIDLLVMERCVLSKSEQPPSNETDEWKQDYELD
jgi:carbamoyltransferase